MLSAEIVVDGDAHQSDGCEVVDRSPQSGAVEAAKVDGLTISEDDVLETDASRKETQRSHATVADARCSSLRLNSKRHRHSS